MLEQIPYQRKAELQGHIMAAVSHRYRFVYFPIPKIATSSMKRVIYKLDTGEWFTNKTQRQLDSSVHWIYPHTRKERWLHCFHAYTSLVLVRDPIKRFLSAYSNRVIHTRSMEKNTRVARQLAKKGLSALPSLEEFTENLERYGKIARYIGAHTIPQSKYVGRFWKDLDHRLPLERIGEVPAIIKEATGEEIELPHGQTGGRKIEVSELSPAHFDKLVKFYRRDYKMLKAFYTPEQLR